MRKFRYLTADEVECRVSTCSDKGVSLLLYKDARADMKILDETVGPDNWQRKHEVVNGNLFCTVSIWDDNKKQWISKEDVGVESFAEKQKGQASDAFKRACINWGIGRELYTAPFIWIGKDSVKLEQRKDKWTTYDKFEVRMLEVENGVITKLIIENIKQKKIVFTYGEVKQTNTQPDSEKQGNKADKPQGNTNSGGGNSELSEEEIQHLFNVAANCKRVPEKVPTDARVNKLVQQVGKQSVNDLTKEEYNSICAWFEGK